MKRNFFATALIATLLAPLFVSAEDAVVTTTAVPTATTVTTAAPKQNPEFITCKKAAIEKRYTAVSAAKKVYSTTMETAFTTRKDAEIAAVDLEKGKEMEANKLAGSNFETSSKTTQKTLNTATESARTTFQSDMVTCNKIVKAEQEKMRAEKESARKAEAEKKKVEKKAEMDKKNAEIKAIRDEAKAKIDAMKKPPVKTTTSTTGN